MERPLPQDRIIIVGAGTAGLATAFALSARGINTTVIAPDLADLRGDSREGIIQRSTPIIYSRTLQRLGLPEEEYSDSGYRANRFRSYGSHNPIAFLSLVALRLGYNFPLQFSSKYLIDEIGLRRTLYRRLTEDTLAESAHSPQGRRGRVTFVDGKVSDVVMKGKRVVGVKVAGQEDPITSGLVIDATGRSAVLARRAQALQPGSIATISSEEEGSLVGTFVAIDRSVASQFPTNRRAHIRMLPGGLISFFGPIAHSESSATHGFFIEGNPQTINAALHQAKQPHQSADEQRLEALSILTQGSDFHDIAQHVTQVTSSVAFAHKSSVFRSVRKIDGLILIGDALMAVNPELAAGFRHIAQDIRRLMRSLGRNNNVERASRKYNAQVGRIKPIRLAWAAMYHKAILLGHKLLGTNKLPKLPTVNEAALNLESIV